ncbi:hypothetical protein AMTRI_Chr08g207220 [Amborella trichopoda]
MAAIVALKSSRLWRPAISVSFYCSRRGRCFCSSTNMATSRTFKVGAVQMTSNNDLHANFTTCSSLVKEAVAAGVNLLCFPENFSFMGAKLGESLEIAEMLDGPIMQQYRSLARDHHIWLSLGGFQEKGPDDKHLCNTHVLLDEAGNIISTYRKIHLPFGHLGLTVCYDLRFPELYQELRFQHLAQAISSEVLLVPSAFTRVTGEAHWEILLRARAIETQCYVIAPTQAGWHDTKRESFGDALVIDPWGTVIARLPDRLSTGIAIAEIDLSMLDSVRMKMPISEHRKPNIYRKSACL